MKLHRYFPVFLFPKGLKLSEMHFENVSRDFRIMTRLQKGFDPIPLNCVSYVCTYFYLQPSQTDDLLIFLLVKRSKW